jgi:hypothetical protein
MLTFLLRLHEGLTSAKEASSPPKIEHLTLQFFIFGAMLTLLHAGFGSEFRIQYKQSADPVRIWIQIESVKLPLSESGLKYMGSKYSSISSILYCPPIERLYFKKTDNVKCH